MKRGKNEIIEMVLEWGSKGSESKGKPRKI
jgi:hypothetical protein